MPESSEERWLVWAPVILVVVVALAASFSGLGNGFAYDDVNAILKNERIHSLADPGRFLRETYWPPGKYLGGSTLYRPLTSLGFAIQWAIGGGQPAFFHFLNVVLYLLVCLAFLWVARAVLPPLGALIAALLFAAHPVHVEAVANVVGQGELWVNLFSLLAVGTFLYRRNPAGLDHSARLVIYTCYALGCLAKDNGLMLPGLLLAAELTVAQDPRPLAVRLRAIWAFWVVLLAVGVLYIALRTRVTGSLAGDYPHILIGTATYPERIFTMLRVILEWPRLLLWPAHLQADYSPRDFDRALSFGPGQVAGLALLASAIWLTVWSWRRRSVVALGMLWFAVAIFPVSNLVLKAGVVLAERTLFLPSAGAMLAVAAGVAALLERQAWPRRLAMAGSGILVLMGTWRSALRQPVWHDSTTLAAQTVRDAPRNYRAHWTYGLNLYESDHRESAFTEIATAIALYPYDPNMFSDAGDLYRTDGQCDRSLDLYRRALDLVPELIYTRSRLASCYMRLGHYEQARAELRRIVAEGHPEFESLILAVDSAAAAANTFR